MIVFGDSYTTGENNNNVSFADYLGIEKHGVSGSCLGNYSIYPVNGCFLTEQHDCNDTILIQYGINDAASLVTGYVTVETVKIAIAKTYDLLKDKDVYFLELTESFRDLVDFSRRYAEYLTQDYLKDLCEIKTYDFLKCYMLFCQLMRKKFKVLYLLPDKFKEYDTDSIHPTDKGYRIIAENIKKQL